MPIEIGIKPNIFNEKPSNDPNSPNIQNQYIRLNANSKCLYILCARVKKVSLSSDRIFNNANFVLFSFFFACVFMYQTNRLHGDFDKNNGISIEHMLAAHTYYV